jgi:hypothetical protein
MTGKNNMLTGKINLAKFEHKLMEFKMLDGTKEECIVVPIKKNSLLRTEKGNVFFDIVAFEIPQEKRKIVKVKTGDKEFDRYESTHIVSQSYDAKKREEMKSAGTYSPTLGNITDSNLQLSSSGSEAANVSESFAAVDDDLPF